MSRFDKSVILYNVIGLKPNITKEVGRYKPTIIMSVIFNDNEPNDKSYHFKVRDFDWHFDVPNSTLYLFKKEIKTQLKKKEEKLVWGKKDEN